MILESMIIKYREMAKNYSLSAASKKYFNEQAAEEDRKQAYEYQQIYTWLEELKAYKEAHMAIKELPQVWEEGAGIKKCLDILKGACNDQ